METRLSSAQEKSFAVLTREVIKACGEVDEVSAISVNLLSRGKGRFTAHVIYKIDKIGQPWRDQLWLHFFIRSGGATLYPMYDKSGSFRQRKYTHDVQKVAMIQKDCLIA